MCDDCDCRSHPQIAALSAEHEVLVGILADLRAAVDDPDADRAGPLLGQLHGLLPDHPAREERGVFHQLRGADVGGTYLAAFERDHRRLHELLGGTRGVDRAIAAGELIERPGIHIAREERDLFPAAHQLLTPAQWASIDAALAEAAS